MMKLCLCLMIPLLLIGCTAKEDTAQSEESDIPAVPTEAYNYYNRQLAATDDAVFFVGQGEGGIYRISRYTDEAEEVQPWKIYHGRCISLDAYNNKIYFSTRSAILSISSLGEDLEQLLDDGAYVCEFSHIRCVGGQLFVCESREEDEIINSYDLTEDAEFRLLRKDTEYPPNGFRHLDAVDMSIMGFTNEWIYFKKRDDSTSYYRIPSSSTLYDESLVEDITEYFPYNYYKNIDFLDNWIYCWAYEKIYRIKEDFSQTQILIDEEWSLL